MKRCRWCGRYVHRDTGTRDLGWWWHTICRARTDPDGAEAHALPPGAEKALRAQIAADIEAHYTPLNGDIGPTDYDEGLHTAALLARGACGFVDCQACARIARGES